MDTPTQQSRSEGDRIDVVYIAGAGRSGSTLLNQMLGSSDKAFSVGELHQIWTLGFGENRQCSCGQSFRACDFWNSVMDAAFGGMDKVPLQRILSLQGRLKRVRAIPVVVQPLRPAALSRQLEEYGHVLAQLYRGIQKTARRRLLVDSSKQSPYGLLLASRPDIRLRAIHLVRDSRAVAFSWTRVKQRSVGSKDIMRRRSPLTSARSWSWVNSVIGLLAFKADAYTRMRYEDLAEDPAKVLASLAQRLDLTAPSPDESNTVELPANHMVGGNPVRFTHGSVTIRRDDEWIGAMRSEDKHKVTLLTWPLLLKYGYPLNSGSNGTPRQARVQQRDRGTSQALLPGER